MRNPLAPALPSWSGIVVLLSIAKESITKIDFMPKFQSASGRINSKDGLRDRN